MRLTLLLLILLFVKQVWGSESRDWNFQLIKNEYLEDVTLDINSDNRGIVYFLKKDFIVEYDGVKWSRIEIPGAKQLQKLSKTSNGRLYVLGKETIGHLYPDEVGVMKFASDRQVISKYNSDCNGKMINVHVINNDVYYICREGVLFDTKPKGLYLDSPALIQSSAVSNGSLYIVTSEKGVFVLKNNVWQKVQGSDGIHAYENFSDAKNRIIFAGIGKGLILHKSKEGTFEYLLENRGALAQEIITGIIQFGDDYVVGTLRSGLKLISSTGQIEQTITEKIGLPGNDIWALFSDHEGTLWVSTENGTGKCYDRDKASSKIFNKANIPFTSLIREISSSKDKELIFGGAYYKEKGGVQTLEWSKLNYKILKSNQNAMRFTFSSNSLGDSNEVEYQTMLEGQDKDWSEWSTRTSREFTNLFWKDYNFKVRARKKGSNEISNTSIFMFTIKTPFFESFLFYILQGVILGGVFLFAALGRDMGVPKVYSEYTTIFILAIIFGFIHNKLGIEAFVDSFEEGGLLKLLVAAVLGAVMKPAETYGEKLVVKIGELKRRLQKS